MWFSLLSSKWTLLAVAVIVVALSGFFVVQYIKTSEATKQRLETIERELETEDNINEELENAPTDAPSILDWLRDRQR